MKRLFSILLLFISLYSFAQTEASDANIKQKINVRNDKIIIIDFYANWCGPCRSMDPVLKQIAQEYSSTVKIYKINVDNNSFGNEHNVTSIPTYLFFKNGKLLKRAEGAIGKNGMKNIINSLSSNNNNNNNKLSDSYLSTIWNDYNALNNVAWNAYEREDNHHRLNKAVKVIKRSIELNTNYYNLDTYGALLFKKRHYVDALKQCGKAIEYAKKNGNDYHETNELILKIIKKL